MAPLDSMKNPSCVSFEILRLQEIEVPDLKVCLLTFTTAGQVQGVGVIPHLEPSIFMACWPSQVRQWIATPYFLFIGLLQFKSETRLQHMGNP